MKIVKVEICQGTSCHLLGGLELATAVRALPMEKLKQIELCTIHCLKNCRQGPSVRIDGKIYAGVTPEQLIALLEEIAFREAS